MNAAKVLRFTSVLTVFVGYVFVFRAGESRLDARIAENAQIAERIAAAERTLASEHVLETERRRLTGTLRTVQLNGARGAQVARFVRDAARVVSAHHAAIATIAVSGSQIAAASVPGRATTAGSAVAPDSAVAADPLDTIALEVTIDGRYADVLAVIRALSRIDVLASLDVASLARKNADASKATVTASLRVVLHRLADVRPRPV